MPYIVVPNGSNVEINCTVAVGTADPPFWSINLAADSSTTRLQFANRKGQLNAHGVYELNQTETPLTLRLLINADTAINNQTEINCDLGTETETITTLLYVFGELEYKLNGLLPIMHLTSQLCKSSRSNSINFEGFSCWCRFCQPHMGLV